MRGKIIMGIAGFYYVKVSQQQNPIFECKARGKFRNIDISPIPGDEVEFDAQENNKGYLRRILPRKNEMQRPRIANVDQLIIVVSASFPQADFMLVDKLIAQCVFNNIEPVICVNKCDEQQRNENVAEFENYQKLGYQICFVSAKNKTGLENLLQILQNKVSCFAGQSAVGKSSILNELYSGETLDVGAMTAKTHRGKHTTRASKLIVIQSGALVADTPGFSLIEIENISQFELKNYYADFEGKICQFKDCMHINEPNCAVKEALSKGEILQSRYDRYCLTILEKQDKRAVYKKAVKTK